MTSLLSSRPSIPRLGPRDSKLRPGTRLRFGGAPPICLPLVLVQPGTTGGSGAWVGGEKLSPKMRPQLRDRTLRDRGRPPAPPRWGGGRRHLLWHSPNFEPFLPRCILPPPSWWRLAARRLRPRRAGGTGPVWRGALAHVEARNAHL